MLCKDGKDVEKNVACVNFKFYEGNLRFYNGLEAGIKLSQRLIIIKVRLTFADTFIPF